MRAVAAVSSPYWTDLKEEVKDDKERADLIKEISARILSGESQVASQDMDALCD
jgi:hypothetical protein